MGDGPVDEVGKPVPRGHANEAMKKTQGSKGKGGDSTDDNSKGGKDKSSSGKSDNDSGDDDDCDCDNDSGVSKKSGKKCSDKQKSSKNCDKSKSKLGRNLASPQASLYGYQDSWYSLSGYGTFYDISSSDGQTLLYSGSLCGDGANGKCNIVLPAGNYVWRVSGALDDHQDMVAWDFCDVYGGSTTEVTFTIDAAGSCAPNKVKLLYDIVGSDSTSYRGMHSGSSYRGVTLEGTLVLNGLATDHITDADTAVIRSVLGQEFGQASAGASGVEEVVRIVSCTANPTVSKKDRSLSEHSATSATIVFQVEVAPEKFGFDSSESTDVTALATSIRNFLQESSMSTNGKSSIFVAKIIAKARASGVQNLQKIYAAELVDLAVVDSVSESILGVPLMGAALGTLLVLILVVAWARKRHNRKMNKITRERAVLDESKHIQSQMPMAMRMNTIHNSIGRLATDRDYSMSL